MNQEVSSRFIMCCTYFYSLIILLACFNATPTQGRPAGGQLNGISLDNTFDGLESILDCNNFDSLDYESSFQDTKFGSFGLWDPNDLKEAHYSEIKDLEPNVSSLKGTRLGTMKDLVAEMNHDDMIHPMDERSTEILYQRYMSILEPESSTRKRQVSPEVIPEKEVPSQLSGCENDLNSGASYPQENTMELGMIHGTLLNDVNETNMEDHIEFTPRIQEASGRLLREMKQKGLLKFKHPLHNYIHSTLSKNYEDLGLNRKNGCVKVKDLETFGNIPISKWYHLARPLEKSRTHYVRKESFMPRMENLINWVLLIHTSTQMEMYPKMSEEEQMESCKVIVDWINHETFLTHSSVPVFGVIHKTNYSMNESAFQEVQLIIIRYLSEQYSNKDCLSTAIALMKIWNRKKSNNIQISDIHFSDNERTYEFLIDSTIAHVSQVVKIFREQLRSILPETNQGIQQDIPQEIIPRKFVHLDDKILDPYSNIILVEIKKLYGLDEPKIRNYHSKTLPVYLVYEKSSHVNSIKISCRDKRHISLNTMISRAKNLLTYLIICKNVIIEDPLLGMGLDIKHLVPESKANLIKMVHKELLFPEKGLPIFGKISSEEDQLDNSNFGQIQILCIYYFSRPRSYMMLPSLFIKFLELWFKQIFPERWNEFFKDDNTFSTHITNLLVSNHTKISEAFEKDSDKKLKKKRKKIDQ